MEKYEFLEIATEIKLLRKEIVRLLNNLTERLKEISAESETNQKLKTAQSFQESEAPETLYDDDLPDIEIDTEYLKNYLKEE